MQFMQPTPRGPARAKLARRLELDSHRNISVELNSTLDSSVDSVAYQSIEMTDVDTIFKALRLVPDFDGNPHVLPRFIHLCDQIVAEYITANPGNELAKLCLINGILNKITGPAARIINSNGISENWDCIKNALINNFSDQRDETALYNDLMLATQGNSSPQEFYDKCVNLFSTIMTYVTLHESVDTTVEAKRVLYKKLTMQAFVRGLKEPLGSRIRCMRPDSAEKALEFVQEELNVMYLQNRNDSVSEKKIQSVQLPKPIQLAPNNFPAFKPFNPVARPPSMPIWQPPQQQWKPNFQQPAPFRSMNMPSRTQQMFRAPPPNYNPHQNNFFSVPRNVPQNQGPKPMSGVSHYVTRERPLTTQLTGHDWRKHGNIPASNYFKTKEMNMNECDSYENYYYPEYYNCDAYDYYYAGNDFYYPESYCVEQSCEPLNECPSGYSDEPQPSTSSVEEQDFQKRMKSDKSK
ncbi:unnamed protein product [Leptosia nina]|uniref:Uncharacterized protein n=1 Tax=Leptosia nina TaxID=320188 RepID=A0AAV1IX41_9NEOP